jgi:hypothetical protein
MKKSLSLIAMSLLAGSLTIPSGRVYADENPPGNHKQREELRRDQQQLEELRQRRNQELREGDRREAREYNEKIRDQKREIRQDRRDIYGQNRDRWHHDRDHDYDHDWFLTPSVSKKKDQSRKKGDFLWIVVKKSFPR